MKKGSLPSKYLGIPLFGGANRSVVWKDLFESCIHRMDGWKSKWLTLAGQILMLKSVVSSILVFSMICLQIPKKLIKVIGQRMRKFFWNGAIEQDKVPLLACDKICQAKVKGGVGLRNWNIMNEALGAKLVRSIYSQPFQLWVKILKAKYLDSMDGCRIFTIHDPPKGSAIWNFIISRRKVIVDHITWQVGTRSNAKFRVDSWNG